MDRGRRDDGEVGSGADHAQRQDPGEQKKIAGIGHRSRLLEIPCRRPDLAKFRGSGQIRPALGESPHASLPFRSSCPAGLADPHAAEAPGVTISAAPERPIVEQRGDGHLLNFDMIVRNKGNQTYRIAKIELSVYDSGGVLAARKALNTDAFAPSITVIGEQLLAPGKSLDIFNPFSQFKPAMPLARLRYDFCLLREDTPAQRDANRHRLPDDCDFVSSLAVTPRTYAGKTPLMLPVRGKVFVWEGHDFYAHHLRVPLGNPRMASMGIAANSNEFANDFIYTDAEGNAYRGDPRTLTNWHSYGKPLYAPGAGLS